MPGFHYHLWTHRDNRLQVRSSHFLSFFQGQHPVCFAPFSAQALLGLLADLIYEFHNRCFYIIEPSERVSLETVAGSVGHRTHTPWFS